MGKKIRLFLPNPASEYLYVSSHDLGDCCAAVCPSGAVIVSPSNAVITGDQVHVLYYASQAAQWRSLGRWAPTNIEIIQGCPPEWRREVEGEGVPA